MNNKTRTNLINAGGQLVKNTAAAVKGFFRSPWTQGLALYALMIGLGLGRNHCAPIVESAGKSVAAPEKKRVRVVTRREGDMTHFLVENLERAEITMTFNFDLTNLKSSKDLPLTGTFPAQQTTEAFCLAPINPDEAWQYTFTNYHNLGSAEAVHDDTYCYNLPYAAGKSYRVSQGYEGKFSHQGSNRYAIDWAVPEGTQVLAARGGLVVKVKDDSDRGGASVDFDKFNNYVIVRHSDGTLGQYCHLRKGGVKVHEGDIVQEGDAIALSGNTGFSSGPHLHFSVYKMKSGKERESIPVKFRTASNPAITLETGNTYKAARTSALVVQDSPANVRGGG